MGQKSRKKKEKRTPKPVPKTVKVEVKPVIEDDEWKRSTYGYVFTLIALMMVIMGLLSVQGAHWPIFKYEPTIIGYIGEYPDAIAIFDGDMPEHYDWMPYLIDKGTEGERWERRMYQWEWPGYYVAFLLLYIAVRFFLPERKKEGITDGNQRE